MEEVPGFTRSHVAVIGEDEDLIRWGREHGVSWDQLYQAAARVGDIEVQYVAFRSDIWEKFGGTPVGGWDSIYDLRNAP
jgi:hypothetical protein